MSTVDIKTPCPHCGVALDAATGADGALPKAGAITICSECFKVSEFDENLQMQKFDLNILGPRDRMRVAALVRGTRAVMKRRRSN